MLGIHDFPLFVVAGLLLNLTPGPDFLYVVGRSAAQGAQAGAAAALGIGAGCFIHIAAAALGLSALLAASATAFIVLKLIGAAYLTYVGASMLWGLRGSGNQPDVSVSVIPPAPLRKIFMQGFLTNALNPKVALFFLAFVPQFIDPTAAHTALAFVVLGVVFNCTGTLWNLTLAWLSARTLGRFERTGLARWLNGCVGAVFVFLGMKLAFARAS